MRALALEKAIPKGRLLEVRNAALLAGKLHPDRKHCYWNPSRNQLRHVRRVVQRRKQLHDDDDTSTVMCLLKLQQAEKIILFRMRANVLHLPDNIAVDSIIKESVQVGERFVYFEV